MSTAIEGLKPELVWKYFAEISRIPRCSKNEAAMTKYVLNTAKKLGLQAKADKFGNVVVRKPASAGRQQARPIALQGHLDMVCEKNNDTVHDFLKDPIELVRKGNVMMANGTTLGADNGVAVATNLAIMEDASIEHGPLEFLFTVDEETGLTGAHNIAGDFLESRTLLNLDSEEEGALYVGCSGGRDSIGSWKVHFVEMPSSYTAVNVTVTGLRGGHSGLEIDKGRGNAIKIMGRAILALDAIDGRLSSINGGNKHNAIPRECEAVVSIPSRALAAAEKSIGELNTTIRAELASVEPDLLIQMRAAGTKKNAKALGKPDHRKIMQTILALPHGVIKMSAEIAGLVETSTNTAVIRTARNSIRIATSQRSSVASEIEEIAQTVASIFNLGGASVESTDGYPGWKPNMDSPILGLAKSAYRSLYGKDPEVKAIHAGLECGILGERIPGMDMLSFGPTLEGVHSPDEKIHIDTVEKFWNFLLEILKRAN
ncbi:MAG TPA: aminoacyl-histidine dipeptidase [Acidobacteriota bacterium]|nr:aminoacyl-histidine dipeptidase [Acidobacteriota bacterium]